MLNKKFLLFFFLVIWNFNFQIVEVLAVKNLKVIDLHDPCDPSSGDICRSGSCVCSTDQSNDCTCEMAFVPEISVGNKFQKGQIIKMTKDNDYLGTTKMLADYITEIYRYLIGIVGILAAVVIMMAGVAWLVSAGNATIIGQAKSYIGGAIMGLILALTSYYILSFINDGLVNFKINNIDLGKVASKSIGCCDYKINNNQRVADISSSSCDQLQGDYHPDLSADVMANECVEYGCCQHIDRCFMTFSAYCKDDASWYDGSSWQSRQKHYLPKVKITKDELKQEEEKLANCLVGSCYGFTVRYYELNVERLKKRIIFYMKRAGPGFFPDATQCINNQCQ